MNFLSHYYLTEDKDDNPFTIGLTLPDIIQYHTWGARVSTKYLMKKVLHHSTLQEKSCIEGMLLHIEVDRWFHTLQDFKECMKSVQDEYYKHTKGKQEFPRIYAHILVEILIDRYLMGIDPGLDYRFYASYRAFDFESLISLLSDVKHFDRKRFLEFTGSISRSHFIHDYDKSHSILDILKRVAARKNLDDPSTIDEEQFAWFVQICYSCLEQSIVVIMEMAMQLWSDRKKAVQLIFDKNL